MTSVYRHRGAWLALAIVYVLGIGWATSAEQAIRRNPRGPLPALTVDYLVMALAESQAAIREQMPWRSGEAIADPRLVAPLLWDRFAGGSRADSVAIIHAWPEWQEHQRASPEEPRPPPPAGPTRIAGQIRGEQGRLWNDAGVFHWQGLTLFDGIHLLLAGDEAEFLRRLDLAAAGRVNVIRVLGMAAVRIENGRQAGLFDLRQFDDAYWTAVKRVTTLANARGIYVSWVIFADAQYAMPGARERGDHVREWVRWAQREQLGKGIVFELANEARKNGWRSATDPDLLLLASALRAELGHPHFMVSDPLDGETPAQTQETIAEFRTLARYSTLLSWHPSRTEHDDGRWRRWIDHAELGAELADKAREVNPDAALILTEAMGSACIREPGRRDNEPDAFVAAALVAAVTGNGWLHHYIASQGDCTPGLLESAIALRVPVTPDYRYVNDSLGDAPSRGFSGADKVRWTSNGRQAYGVAYGADVSRLSITWVGGWRPAEEIFRSAHVVLLRAVR